MDSTILASLVPRCFTTEYPMNSPAVPPKIEQAKDRSTSLPRASSESLFTRIPPTIPIW